jgi:hypothetical protein
MNKFKLTQARRRLFTAAEKHLQNADFPQAEPVTPQRRKFDDTHAFLKNYVREHFGHESATSFEWNADNQCWYWDYNETMRFNVALATGEVINPECSTTGCMITPSDNRQRVAPELLAVKELLDGATAERPALVPMMTLSRHQQFSINPKFPILPQFEAAVNRLNAAREMEARMFGILRSSGALVAV